MLFFNVEFSKYYLLIISILLVAIISFIDDLVSLSTSKRMIIHFLAFTLVFFDLGIFKEFSLIGIGLVFLTYLFSLGYLNIYNFMDGINGITFLNALVSYVTFYIINEFITGFTNSDLLLLLIFSTLIFGYFNFREKPKCFAGDVGSITIGFTIIYFITKLFLTTNDYGVFLVLGVYLVDGGWTIVERIIRKENVFEAHKRHLYQLFANEIKTPHLKISMVYFIIQLCLNLIVICILSGKFENNILFTLCVFGGLSLLYFLVKRSAYSKIYS